jgi:hypothetical protein
MKGQKWKLTDKLNCVSANSKLHAEIMKAMGKYKTAKEIIMKQKN